MTWLFNPKYKNSEYSENEWLELLENKIWRQKHLRTFSCQKSRVHHLYGGEHIIEEPQAKRLRTTIHFVPDSRIITIADFREYINFTSNLLVNGGQKLLLSLLDDFNDELVPKWIQITLEIKDNNGIISESILIEDRQPGWNDPSITTRVPIIAQRDW